MAKVIANRNMRFDGQSIKKGSEVPAKFVKEAVRHGWAVAEEVKSKETVDSLKAKLTELGVEFNASATKADLQQLLNEQETD